MAIDARLSNIFVMRYFIYIQYIYVDVVNVETSFLSVARHCTTVCFVLYRDCRCTSKQSGVV